MNVPKALSRTKSFYLYQKLVLVPKAPNYFKSNQLVTFDLYHSSNPHFACMIRATASFKTSEAYKGLNDTLQWRNFSLNWLWKMWMRWFDGAHGCWAVMQRNYSSPRGVFTRHPPLASLDASIKNEKLLKKDGSREKKCSRQLMKRSGRGEKPRKSCLTFRFFFFGFVPNGDESGVEAERKLQCRQKKRERNRDEGERLEW